MINTVIVLLSCGMIISVASIVYYAYRDSTEKEEISERIKDFEMATRGYCKGELNGAYNRMLKRQKSKHHER